MKCKSTKPYTPVYNVQHCYIKIAWYSSDEISPRLYDITYSSVYIRHNLTYIQAIVIKRTYYNYNEQCTTCTIVLALHRLRSI